ncbi:MAG TPA: CBS domain-containing protein, partial [Thermoanaerobaculia bacterium]
MWSFLIGSFLRTAAVAAYQQTLLRESLRGSTVREFMKADVVTVPREITAGTDAVDALARMHRARQSRLLVMDGDRLGGILTLKDLLRFLALRVELEERPR